MWREIGTTVRKAMNSWGATARLAVCVAVLATAAVAVIFVAGM